MCCRGASSHERLCGDPLLAAVRCSQGCNINCTNKIKTKLIGADCSEQSARVQSSGDQTKEKRIPSYKICTYFTQFELCSIAAPIAVNVVAAKGLWWVSG